MGQNINIFDYVYLYVVLSIVPMYNILWKNAIQ